MIKILLLTTAVIYWFCFAFRAYLWGKEISALDRKVSHLEKAALLIFTAGLVLYIGKLQVIAGEVRSTNYDMPVSFMLFAWCISAANLATEIAYNNRWSAIFSNLWTGLALTISPSAAVSFEGLFTYDLEWLNFHRLCFLLGYAFCALAFPLVLFFCLTSWRRRSGPESKREQTDQVLWSLDRMTYRMILWALPLLTAGIITEALILLEANQLPSPDQIWTDKTETLLALAAWFLCGIYLHTRLFFGWRNLRAAGLYLAGLTLILIGHFSYGLARHS
jgi:ABC-type transport system involved in cytochrome c biogenesis permease subunit